MNTRTTVASGSGLIDSLKGAARLRRARTLYACGQALASRADAASSARAARLYRRALELLGAAGSLPKTPERALARDRLRGELDQHGLRKLVLAKPRLARALVAGVILAGVAFVATRWLEPDLAAGKRWVASSAWGAFPRSGVMTGEAPIDGRFHTVEQQQPWVQLDLGALYSVHAVRVENRTNCCRERALPLSIELSVDGQTWTRVGYRRILFDTFTQHFSSRQARYVRLRVDRRSTLHLRRISVY